MTWWPPSGGRLRNTVPKEAVIGQWSERDFLDIVPAAVKPADNTLIKQFADHLSMPYACMLNGKAAHVPTVVAAECLSFPDAASAQILAGVDEAFQ
jgi:hypothetical protein